MRIGSLFSGAGGLDLAVAAVFGGEIVWHAEIDKAASKVLAHRFPGVPNLGDITAVGWAGVPAVDVLCGGFPCQDVSAAGKRAGIKAGTRSGLWSVFADAIDALRPQWVVIENVRGLLSATAQRTVDDADSLEPSAGVVGDGSDRPVLRALGAVLGDLCDLGYDAQWATVAASSVGAPHRRGRVFILAFSSNTTVTEWRGAKQQLLGAPVGSAAEHRERISQTAECHGNASDAPRYGWDEGRPEPARLVGGFDAAVSGDGHVDLLPTPAACNPNDGEGAETWLARRAEVKERVKNGNGMGMPLSIAVQLLPTPQARDHKGTDSEADHNRRSPGMDAVSYHFPALLPTPQAFDQVDYVRTPEQLAEQAQRPNGGGARSLREVIVNELPEPTLLSTPQARDFTGVPADNFNNANLCRDVANTAQWGKYAPAIARWEQIVGPAPAPTEPNKNGNPRLAAAFSQWLMGWPAGWVTDPAIGISRNDQLRIVGNGVCPQQAIAALRYLLSVNRVSA